MRVASADVCRVEGSSSAQQQNLSGNGPRSALQLVVFWKDELRPFGLPARGKVTIGRSKENMVCIDHGSVSRRHAVLHVGEQLVIEDLGASNGTFLAGPTAAAGQTASMRQLQRESAEIAVGDTVTIGAVTFLVRRAPESISPLSEGLEPGAPGVVIVRDPKMRAVYAQAELVARAPITVIVLGETGVGKEVLARAIHARSPRAAGPFLGINCAALSESLLEAELFGHEKGAFTGALQARAGLFEAANGGTFFLDEVGELPSATQVKLLRVLEDRTVLRIGARSPRPIDVRFVAATNRDLEAEVAAGRFRQDLFFRLNGVSLTIPPLRERPEDLDALISTFVASACRQMDRQVAVTVSAEALSILRVHSWPGNLRELRNVIERAVALCAGAIITPDDLPGSVRPGYVAVSSAPPAPRAPTSSEPPPTTRDLQLDRFRDEIRSLERIRITEALNRCQGNQTQAAKLLGISRRTLVTRLGEFGLPRPRKGSRS